MPSSPSHRQSQPQRGFTLVEIMAATGIMMVVILVVLTLTTNILASWTRSSGQLQTNFEGRVAMDLLTSDLESMVVRSRNICWLQVEYQTVGAATNSPILYFFAPTLERPRKKADDTPILGDVCAISYRLAYQNPFTGNVSPTGDPRPGDQPAYGLYRAVIDSENTFAQGLALPAIDSSDFSNTLTLADYWAGDSIITDTGTFTATTFNEQGDSVNVNSSWAIDDSNFLSQHVAEFRVIFWFENKSTGALTPMTSDLTDGKGVPEPFVFDGSQLYMGTNGATSFPAKPLYVDISLTILDDEGAELLNQATISYDQALNEHGRTFSRRINLVSNPL